MTAYPSEYLRGIDFFNEGKFFEAHEVWESIWMRSAGQERIFYQALIQAAGALLHVRNVNRQGALHLFTASLEKFSRVPREFLGLPVKEFSATLSGLLAHLQETGPNPSVVTCPAETPKIALTCVG